MSQHIYQEYLNEELERRKERNTTYSLRAFARDLGVPAPKLSQYLSGKCGISGAKARLIAEKMRLGALETELFACSAESAHARSDAHRKIASQKLKGLLDSTFSRLNMDQFAMIRDWYHVALLELAAMDDFKNDAEWMGQALGISAEKAREGFDRLVALNLLREDGGRWVQATGDLETPPDLASRAIREHHRQMLDLVGERFEAVPVEKRELGVAVFSVDAALVPELKLLLRRHQKEIGALLERSQRKNSVYAHCSQLLPLYESKGAQ